MVPGNKHCLWGRCIFVERKAEFLVDLTTAHFFLLFYFFSTPHIRLFSWITRNETPGRYMYVALVYRCPLHCFIYPNLCFFHCSLHNKEHHMPLSLSWSRGFPGLCLCLCLCHRGGVVQCHLLLMGPAKEKSNEIIKALN